MSFTPHPHTGSTWWIRRLPATTQRASASTARGPLLRTLASGESVPPVVTLGPADHASLADRDARKPIGGGR